MILTTARATSAAPSPPIAQWSAISASTPSALHFSFTSAISASVSAEKRLIETTAGMPNFCMFSTWRCEVGHAGFERLEVLGLEVFLLDAAVHLQRADGRDEHGAVGLTGRSCGT